MIIRLQVTSVNTLLKFFITSFFAVAPGLVIDEASFNAILFPLELEFKMEKLAFFSLELISSNFTLFEQCPLLV